MVLEPIEITALLIAIKGFVAALAGEKDKTVLRNSRAALRHLHFSERTIERLANLESEEGAYVAISQRDNARSVQRAFEEPLSLAQEDRLSLVARRKIEFIVHSKTNIRAEIARSLFAASERKGFDTSPLVMAIRELNSAIEELDEQIGGILV